MASKKIKGYTAFKLREKYVELKSRLPCLWTRSYHAGTVGHVSEETVKKYIENQKKCLTRGTNTLKRKSSIPLTLKRSEYP